MSSSAEDLGAGLVTAFEEFEQLAGDEALEAPSDLAGGLALGGPAGGVGAGLRVIAQAGLVMMCRARLSCRSPDRFNRWRVCCPDEAEIGLTPARAANAATRASDRSPPACDQLTSTRLALSGADGPHTRQFGQPRGSGVDERGDLGVELVGSGLEELDALSGGS